MINVSIGRQLFVDDFLIDKSDLVIEYHKPTKYKDNPIFKPEKSWEKESCPVACPKSGGIFYDEKEKKYKMWYEASWLRHMAYAESVDGLHFERPNLDIVKGTNIILDYKGFELEKGFTNVSYLRPDSTTVFIDPDTTNNNEKYKLFLRNPDGITPAIVATSMDGIHFNNFHLTPATEDRSTIFYNPFRKKWVYSIRDSWKSRARSYYECNDFIKDRCWTETNKIKWLSTDEKDLPNPYVDNYIPDLYNVDCVGYESIMVGMFQILYGPDNITCEKRGLPKITELMPIYSRDGFHFTRPDRDTFIKASNKDGSWDRGYIQSVGGVLIIHKDELWIYYIGFSGDETKKDKIWFENGMYCNGATGLAILRRDGFASINGEGYLLTKSIKFIDREKMFVNVDGRVTIDILDANNKLIVSSEEINTNSTDVMVDFKNFDLSVLNGCHIKLLFRLSGKLYSFRFADKNNDSHGAHAAGLVE